MFVIRVNASVGYGFLGLYGDIVSMVSEAKVFRSKDEAMEAAHASGINGALGILKIA